VLVEQKVKVVVLAAALEVILLSLPLRQMAAAAVVEMLRQQMVQVVALVAEPEEIYLALVELEILLLLLHLKEITVGLLLEAGQLSAQVVGVERLQTLKMEALLKAVTEEMVLLVVLLEVVLHTLAEVVAGQILQI
jgi:hypothetical protein